MSIRGERSDPHDWDAQATQCAYFLLPDGTYFVQRAMGGLPNRYKQPVTHPAIGAAFPTLHPAATHLEFVRTALYIGPSCDRLYLYQRALRLQGPMGDATSWVDVPLLDDEVHA